MSPERPPHPQGLQGLRTPKSFRRRFCNSEKGKKNEGEKEIGGEKTKKKKNQFILATKGEEKEREQASNCSPAVTPGESCESEQPY